MAEYDNTNTGVLFKNDRKESEKHPDYTGKVNMEGKDMRLAAWIKEGKNGKFMSLALSEFQEKEESATVSNDDIPF